MKHTKWMVGRVALVVISLAGLIQACGKPQSRAEALRGMDTGGAIPAGKSVTAVNPYLRTTFIYNQAVCRAKDGSTTPVYDSGSAGFESIQFLDTSVIWSVTDASGCQVVSTFQILGIDTKAVALGGRQLAITKDGFPSSEAECAGLIQPLAPGAYLRFEYLLDGGNFSRLQNPTFPCESDELNQFIYMRE